MQHFLKKLLKFSVAGIISAGLLFVLYVYTDPFKTLYSYSNCSNYYVTPNRENISYNNFICHNPQNQYNAFIFGSSRTKAFRTESWKKYLPADAKPYLFDASAESLNGICQKLQFLDEHHYPLQHVLIILCEDVLFYDAELKDGYLFIKNPALAGTSKFKYQWEFFKAFVNPSFLSSYVPFLIQRTYKPYMSRYIEDRHIYIDTITNEMSIAEEEYELLHTPKSYYEKRKHMFYQRIGEQTDTISYLTGERAKILQKIHALLKKNHTDYKVVISPLYNQRKFSTEDQCILRQTFGKNLYDYSGKNQFTSSIYNFYETSHYLPKVGDQLLREIYP